MLFQASCIQVSESFHERVNVYVTCGLLQHARVHKTRECIAFLFMYLLRISKFGKTVVEGSGGPKGVSWSV